MQDEQLHSVTKTFGMLILFCYILSCMAVTKSNNTLTQLSVIKLFVLLSHWPFIERSPLSKIMVHVMDAVTGCELQVVVAIFSKHTYVYLGPWIHCASSVHEVMCCLIYTSDHISENVFLWEVQTFWYDELFFYDEPSSSFLNNPMEVVEFTIWTQIQKHWFGAENLKQH